MHRSGTSLLAHMISAAGIYAGPDQLLIPATPANQDGFWEHAPLVRFNDFLLSQMNASWMLPPISTDYVRTKAKDRALFSHANSLINNMDSHKLPWFWKDPRLCILLPFWKSLLISPVYVVIVRHPMSIAASLRQRNYFPITASLLLWQVYLCSILKELVAEADTLLIEYDQLIEAPEIVCPILEEFLTKFHKLASTKDVRLKRMVKCVRPELCHRRDQSGSANNCIMDSAQVALYNELKSSVNKPVPLISERAQQLYPGWHDYLALWEGAANLVKTLAQKL